MGERLKEPEIKVWETPLPTGYSTAALLLRRWLLNIRLKVNAMPYERQLMLERKLNEFHSHGKSGIVNGSRANTCHLLAKANRR